MDLFSYGANPFCFQEDPRAKHFTSVASCVRASVASCGEKISVFQMTKGQTKRSFPYVPSPPLLQRANAMSDVSDPVGRARSASVASFGSVSSGGSLSETHRYRVTVVISECGADEKEDTKEHERRSVDVSVPMDALDLVEGLILAVQDFNLECASHSVESSDENSQDTDVDGSQSE